MRAQCGGGELYFRIKQFPTNYTFDLTIQSNEYDWLWNFSLLKPYPTTFASSSFTTKKCVAYASAKNGSAPDIIPWGIYSIEMKIKNQIGNTVLLRNFSIDIRDENWARYGLIYIGVDTFIEYDTTNNTLNFTARQNGINRSQLIVNNGIYRIWEIWQVSTPLQSNFKIPVELKNSVEGTGNSFGYLNVDNVNVISGNKLYFKDLVSNTVEHGTLDTTYNNTRKYSFKWENNINVTTVGQNNLYYRTYNFSIDRLKNDKIIKRLFRTVYPLTVKNLIPEKSNITEGEISFKDPTTDNVFHLYLASGNGYVNNEIFTGLNIPVGTLPDQKYAIKAVPSFTASGINYNWYDGDFNPSTQLDFMVTGATNLNAKYKGNLISNSGSGFSTNSQRKVVRTDDGKLHMVYESLDKVWYTYSTDNGVTWQPEQLVDYTTSNAKNASITHNSNAIFITYQSNEGPRIKAARFSNGQKSWITNVYSLSSYDYDTRPVIAAYSSEGALIVFKPTSTSQLRGINVKCYTGTCVNGTVGSDFVISYSTTSSTNPSLVYNSQRMFLAFQNGTEIRYEKLTAGVDYENIFESTLVSSGSGFTNNISPSISVQAENPVVSWSGYTSGIPAAVIRRKTGSTWSGFNSFGLGTVRSSNNNSRRDTGEGSVIAWCDIYNVHKFVRLDNGTYTTIKTLPESGGNGEIQIGNGDGFSDMKAIVFKSPTSGIYPLKFVNYNFLTLQKTDDKANNYGRMAIVEQNNKSYVYYLGDIKIDGENIRFNNYVDSLKIEDSNMLNEIFVTEPFTLNKKSEIEFNNSFYAFDNSELSQVKGNDISYSIELMNISNKKIVKEFNGSKYELSKITDDRTRFKLNLNNIDEGNYILRVVCKMKGEGLFYINDFQSEETLSLNKSLIEINIEENKIPQGYNLENNYPNPFNPTTTINYTIPKGGNVRLEIYNSLGEIVNILKDSYEDAGSHTITWNGKDSNGNSLSSGIYFYRLVSNDFAQVKKMTLIK
ncbi:MAG: FlgD immunoglobulin-like domain containing protein [Melioribacteraceae bacterium]